MWKLIRNIGCLTIIILGVFLVFSIIMGGGKIRELGDKTTGIIKRGFHYAADRADEIQKSFNKYFETLSKPIKSDEKRDSGHKKS